MTLFRAEVFDKEFNFIGLYTIAESGMSLIWDYIVPENSTIVIPGKTLISKRNYVRIRAEGDEIYTGIVEDYTYDNNRTTVNLRRPISLFDLNVYMDTALIPDMSLERWVGKYISETFGPSDPYQEITGLSITYNSETFGEIDEDDKDLYNLHDVIVHIFNVYGIVMKAEIDIPNQAFSIEFTKVDSESIYKFNTQFSDVLDYEIKVTGSSKKPNKIRYLNDDDLEEELTYYWHPSEFEGSVDTDPTTNRVIPVYMTTKRVAAVEERVDKDGNVTKEGKTFQEVAYEDALKSMYQDRWNDMISVMVIAHSVTVPIGEIGQLYRIYDYDFNHPTILTAIERINDNVVRLTFGTVRTRLTQLLKLEGRTL